MIGSAIAHLDNEGTSKRVPVEVLRAADTPRFWECRHAVTKVRLMVMDLRLTQVDGRP